MPTLSRRLLAPLHEYCMAALRLQAQGIRIYRNMAYIFPIFRGAANLQDICPYLEGREPIFTYP